MISFKVIQQPPTLPYRLQYSTIGRLRLSLYWTLHLENRILKIQNNEKTSEVKLFIE